MVLSLLRSLPVGNLHHQLPHLTVVLARSILRVKLGFFLLTSFPLSSRKAASYVWSILHQKPLGTHLPIVHTVWSERRSRPDCAIPKETTTICLLLIIPVENKTIKLKILVFASQRRKEEIHENWNLYLIVRLK